jgi:hypothetical protein
MQKGLEYASYGRFSEILKILKWKRRFILVRSDGTRLNECGATKVVVLKEWVTLNDCGGSRIG